MAKKCKVMASRRPPRFPVQARSRCNLCGRPRAYMRKFGLCRICFRTYASRGEIPGVRKSSW